MTTSREDLLVETVKKLSEQMERLQEDIGKMKQRSSGASGRGGAGARGQTRLRSRGCDFCKRKNQADTCRHCWSCGAGDHLSYQCKKASNDQ